jgi:hypothetical protein
MTTCGLQASLPELTTSGVDHWPETRVLDSIPPAPAHATRMSSLEFAASDG